jgi:hypothetical protein
MCMRMHTCMHTDGPQRRGQRPDLVYQRARAARRHARQVGGVARPLRACRARAAPPLPLQLHPPTRTPHTYAHTRTQVCVCGRGQWRVQQPHTHGLRALWHDGGRADDGAHPHRTGAARGAAMPRRRVAVLCVACCHVVCCRVAVLCACVHMCMLWSALRVLLRQLAERWQAAPFTLPPPHTHTNTHTHTHTPHAPCRVRCRPA